MGEGEGGHKPPKAEVLSTQESGRERMPFRERVKAAIQHWPNRLRSRRIKEEGEHTREQGEQPASQAKESGSIGRLEEKRFIINSESRAVLKNLRESFNKIQQKNPHLSGLGFFGSRTKGAERENSDYDLIVFYDSSKNLLLGADDFAMKFMNAGFVSNLFKGEDKPDIVQCDITAKENKRRVRNFINEVHKHVRQDGFCEKGWDRDLFPLQAQFYLAVGDDVYKSRKLILEEFKSVPNGDKYFQTFMKSLAYIERKATRPQHVELGHIDLPMYERFPKNIREAEKYFTIKPKSHEELPDHEGSFLQGLNKK
jgi:Polymerase beta, Nucleotidyltransferase